MITLKEAISRNESLPCSVRGCHHFRYKLYASCSHHFFQRRNYGHPESRAISKKELKYERMQIEELIEKNKDHEGIKNAIAWFDKWLVNAAEGRPGTPGLQQLCNLYYAGKTGRDLLVTCATLWLFSYRNQRYFPDNLSLEYGLAHQLTRMIKLEQRYSRSGKKKAVAVKGKTKKEIGEYIRQNLGVLFVNICHHLQNIEEEKHLLNQTMARPLVS